VSSDDAPAAWSKSAVNVHLSATDSLSGVDKTYYSVDGSAPSIVATSAVVVSAEGTTTLKYYTVDKAGNAEAVKSVAVRIDTVAPVTTSDAAASYNSTATILLLPTDSTSGIDYTEWRLDSGSWNAGTIVTAPSSATGTHLLEWRSVDKAANTEAIRSATLRIDGRYEQDDIMTSYVGTWSQNVDGAASGGSYKVTATPGSALNLAFRGTNFSLIGMKTAYSGIANVTLDGGAPIAVDLYSANAAYRAVLWTSGALADGQHTIRVEYTGSKNASSGGDAVYVDAFDVAGSLIPRRYEQDDAMASYAGSWAQNPDGGASGGSYKVTVTPGSALNVTLTGRSVDLIGMKTSFSGIANVTLDGGAPVAVDLYNPSSLYRQKVWSSGPLTDGQHTVKVEYTGSKNASSGGDAVYVDAVDVVGVLTPRRTEQDDAMTSYTGSWSLNSDSAASGGAYRITTTPGSTVNLAFNGTSFNLVGIKAAHLGIARITLDGGTPQNVDMYSPTLGYKQTVWSSGTLADGQHTIRVEYTGTKNAASSDTGIIVDGFDIVGSLVPRRYEQDDAMSSFVGPWSLNSDPAAYGGSYRICATAGSAVNLAFSGRSFNLIGQRTAYSGIAKITVDGGTPQTVDFYSATTAYRQVVWTSGTLLDADHTVKIEYTGTKNAASGGDSVNLDSLEVVGVLTPRRNEQDDPMTSYTGAWSSNSDPAASGGSYRISATPGSGLNMAFNGTRFNLISEKTAYSGIARVTLDGGTPVNVDLYSATPAYKQTVWSSGALTDGQHTIKVEYTGSKNASSGADAIIVDAFDIVGSLSPRRYEQDDNLAAYTGAWSQNPDSAASGGSYKVTATSGSSVNLAFSGRNFDLIAMKTAYSGIAKVTLDSSTTVNVDLYSATLAYRQVVWSSGALADGPHTVKIEYTGTKNAASGGDAVYIDAFDTVGVLTNPADVVAPKTVSTADSTWYSSPATITLSATDAGSGVRNTYFSLGASAVTTYTTPIVVSSEGANTLKFYSVDVAGNIEATNTATVKIDLTAPLTGSDATASMSTSDTIHLTPTDALSGVASTSWRVDNGSWNTGTQIALASLSTGPHSIDFYSVDVAGNAEASKNATFTVLTRFDQSSALISYLGTWGFNSDSGSIGGTYAFSPFPGSSAETTFTGTRFDLMTAVGPASGIARITVDGGTPVLVDLYAPAFAWHQRAWSTGTLASGPHTVKIECTGSKNASSTDVGIIVDAVDVIGTLTP
jgi:hypothetical protein